MRSLYHVESKIKCLWERKGGLFDEASPDEALNVCNFDTIGRA